MTGARPDGSGRLADLGADIEAVGERLVHLDPVPFEQLRRLLAATRLELLERHPRECAEPSADDGARRPGAVERRPGDLETFRLSVSEFEHLLGVVEADPHGGNRQALGQYLRVLAEAIEHHLEGDGRPVRRPAGTTVAAP